MNTTHSVKNGSLYSPEVKGISDGILLDTGSIRKDPDVAEHEIDCDKNKISTNFTISITKKCKFSICKPLIPLRLVWFIWYGASTTIYTFIIVFYKQKGITLTEFSLVYILTPIVQFVGPAVCGIIADKIGRSKPVLIGNLILTILVIIGMLLVPRINIEHCDSQYVNLKCHHQEFGRLIAKTSCNMNKDIIALSSCNVTCPENVTQYCHGQNLICEMLEGNENFDNLSLSVHVNKAYKLKDKCYYNVTSMSHKNATYSWCNVPHKMYCRIYCLMNSDEDCSVMIEHRTKYLIYNIVLLILFFSVFSNGSRIMDVTAMCLVKEYNSDFGRERFFALAGVLVFSPLSGFLIDVSTAEGEEDNYNVAFYVFIGLILLMLGISYYLKVSILPPGKKMFKKSIYLLKSPDNIAFILVLTVLGMGYGFTRNYTVWFLQGMNSPSLLLGLLGAMNSIYGLPFLLTSKWWVKQFGATQIFILSLLGYVANGIGLSLLYDPWFALLTEATSVVTYHLLWVAVVVHSHSIAPEGLIATVIATAGGFHFSIGKGLGGMAGGLLMDTYGARIAFRMMALFSLIYAALYAMYLYIRRKCFTGVHEISVKDDNVIFVSNNESRPKLVQAIKDES